MADTLHIFTAAKRRLRSRKLYYAWCCGQRRRAKNLYRQEFYDSCRHWCVPGKGCKR